MSKARLCFYCHTEIDDGDELLLQDETGEVVHRHFDCGPVIEHIVDAINGFFDDKRQLQLDSHDRVELGHRIRDHLFNEWVL